MPRRKIVEKRKVTADPRFNSVLVSKFTNGIMECGKNLMYSIGIQILIYYFRIIG